MADIPQWPTLLMGAGLTLIGSGVVTFMTARVNLKKTYQEKWWALKCEAYSRITEALHHASYCLEQWADEDIQQGNWSFSEEKKNELDADFRKAIRELNIATGIGAYIISDAVAEVLAGLTAHASQFDPSEPRWEQYQADSDAYKAALKKVRTLAKEDLKVV